MTEIERSLDAGLHGVKLDPARQGFVLLEPIVEPLLELAARRAVPVYVVTGVSIASAPLQLSEVARRYPSVAFVMGRSGRTDYGWLDLLAAVRQAPNIYVETALNLPAGLTRLIAAIGPQRVLFASHTPMTYLGLELEKLEQLDVAPADRAAILGGNLLRLVGLAPPSAGDA